MAEFVARRPIKSVVKHPNADKLAIVKVGAFQVIHTLKEAENFTIGQIVIHFPTDICLHPIKAKELGVDNYCRSVEFEGKKFPCRIVAARLRGVPSYGFIIPDNDIPEEDLDNYYGVWKYEPPEPNVGSDAEMHYHNQFPKYTKIKRIQLRPEAWKEGTPVRITEKLHGQNVRLGVVQDEQGDWRYMVGSHNVIVKEESNGRTNFLWQLLDDKVMNLLNYLCDAEKPVVIFGERIGQGVQDLDYGFSQPVLRVFDIMIDGQYQSWDLIKQWCDIYEIETVPLLYEGTFSWCLVDNMTDGGSTVQNPSVYQSKFKGREGIVITPLEEQHSEILNGRLIAKSVSVDYEERRGGTEYH